MSPDWSPPGTAAGLHFTGVTLRDPELGSAPVADLLLAIDDRGLTTAHADRSGAATVSWHDLGGFSRSERSLADGTNATVLSAAIGGRPVEWLIPARQFGPPAVNELGGVLARRTLQSARLPNSDLVRTLLGPTPARAAEPAPTPPPGYIPVAGPGGGPQWRRDPRGAIRQLRSESEGRWLFDAVVLLAALVIAAIVLPLAANSPPAHPTGGTVTHVTSAIQVARQIDVVQGDFPAGWTPDTSNSGPLSGFLSPSAGGGGLSRSETKAADKVVHQFESCVGVSARDDRIFGTAGSTPIAEAPSPAFIQSGTMTEAGSTVSIFSAASSVHADLSQIGSAKFPMCFGVAIGALFTEGGQSAGPGIQVGNPTVTVLTLPQLKGSRSVGVTITLPIMSAGATLPIQIGVVLVGGGKAEATLYTYDAGGQFPLLLTAGLTAALDRRIVLESNATGV